MGWLLERNWESWDLLTAKGNGSAKLAILKESELTLANERQTDPALITGPWVMASRMNAYNDNGMDLWQQGQEWGRKKEGRWMCVPAVAFEVPKTANNMRACANTLAPAHIWDGTHDGDCLTASPASIFCFRLLRMKMNLTVRKHTHQQKGKRHRSSFTYCGV